MQGLLPARQRLLWKSSAEFSIPPDLIFVQLLLSFCAGFLRLFPNVF